MKRKTTVVLLALLVMTVLIMPASAGKGGGKGDTRGVFTPEFLVESSGDSGEDISIIGQAEVELDRTIIHTNGQIENTPLNFSATTGDYSGGHEGQLNIRFDNKSNDARLRFNFREISNGLLPAGSYSLEGPGTITFTYEGKRTVTGFEFASSGDDNFTLEQNFCDENCSVSWSGILSFRIVGNKIPIP